MMYTVIELSVHYESRPPSLVLLYTFTGFYCFNNLYDFNTNNTFIFNTVIALFC